MMAVEVDPAPRVPAWRSVAQGVGAGFKRRPWLVFLVAGIAFLGFASLSFNLFTLLSANVGLIAEHGLDVLADGAAQQFVELLLSGYGALACYLLFKYCERIIVDWLDTFK
ncbi:MAG: hypothetical protein ACREBN_01505 [Burkholderiaceae bacterium]